MARLAEVLHRLLLKPSEKDIEDFCEVLANTQISRDGTWSSTNDITPDEESRYVDAIRKTLNVSKLERLDVLILSVLKGLPGSLKIALGASKFWAVKEYLTPPAGAQVSYAISGGYDLNCRQNPVPPPAKFFITPLHFAAVAGRPKLVSFLIHDCKADPNSCIDVWCEEAGESKDAMKRLVLSKEIGGWTALHVSCGEEEVQKSAVVANLLKGGADVAARDCFGWTPAAHALLSGSVASMALLAEVCADSAKLGCSAIRDCDGCGSTPLRRIAARMGSAEMAAVCEYLTDTLPPPVSAALPTADRRSLSNVGFPFFTTEGVQDALENPSTADAPQTATTTTSDGEVGPEKESLWKRFFKAPWKTFMAEEEPKRTFLFAMVFVIAALLFFFIPSEIKALEKEAGSFRQTSLRTLIVGLWDIAMICYLICLGCIVVLALHVPRRRWEATAGGPSSKGKGLVTLARVLADWRMQESICCRESPFEGSTDLNYSELRGKEIDRRKKKLADMDPATRLCTRCLAWRPVSRCYHCNRCGVCTVGLDHHCDFFLGCIGVDTHRKFVTFTTAGGLMNLSLCAAFLLLGAAQLNYRCYVYHLFTYASITLVAPTGVWMSCLAGGQHINIIENLMVFEHIKGEYLPNFWRRVPRRKLNGDAVEYVWQWRNPYNEGWMKNIWSFWLDPSSRLHCNMDRVITQDRQFVESLVESAGVVETPRGILAKLGAWFVPDYRPAGHIKIE